MTKEELKARYSRVPTDFSQTEMLKDQLLESGLLDVAQHDPTQAGKAVIVGEDGILTLGEAGSDAVGFDGEIEVHYDSSTNTYWVLNSDLTAIGAEKLVKLYGSLHGFAATRSVGPGWIQITSGCAVNNYSTVVYLETSASEDQDQHLEIQFVNVVKLYKHTITFNTSVGGIASNVTIVYICESSTAFTSFTSMPSQAVFRQSTFYVTNTDGQTLYTGGSVIAKVSYSLYFIAATNYGTVVAGTPFYIRTDYAEPTFVDTVTPL